MDRGMYELGLRPCHAAITWSYCVCRALLCWCRGQQHAVVTLDRRLHRKAQAIAAAKLQQFTVRRVARQMRILLVDDKADLANPLAKLLREQGYAVDIPADVAGADELNFVNDYDLIILDWAIPPPTGMELLRHWRAGGDSTPVLMLTGRRSVEDLVSGLDSGADDCLTKPVSVIEFLARVRSLLRRRQKAVRACLEAGDVTMDRGRHRVIVDGSTVFLSPKEFAMLEYFLCRPEEVITRTDLIEHVWDDAFDSMSNVVDVTIFRLRSKIDGGRSKKLLHTEKGVGYILKLERS